ncbi:MAG TPA: hypothetical protein VFZ34_25940 [Blastocatellia bacterium]|nr:hypothetical protein [Blastocatellia bacterium]
METETSNIVRYLLGDLPEDEQVQVEDRAFADRAFLRSIEDAENDLIDDYVRGALTETERRQFERRFLASAERQKKVEFARTLARVTATKTAAHPATTMNWWEALVAFFSSLNPVFQFSLAAAALLLLLGVPWLATQTIRLRQQVIELQAEQTATPIPTQPPTTQTEELQRQLAEQQKRNEELARQLQNEQQQRARLQNEPPVALRPVIASLFLAPGLSRSSDKRPQIVLPSTARTVRLQIGLERGDDFPSYRVEINTAQGQTVWTRDRLQPQGRLIPLTIPAQMLRTGQYEVTLQGVTEAQQTEDVRFYYFDVRKK